ncbi:5002_t:CDS:1, partial [Dentiscutata erythropus]
ACTFSSTSFNKDSDMVTCFSSHLQLSTKIANVVTCFSSHSLAALNEDSGM